MSTPLTYTLEGTTAVLRMDDGKANALSEAMIDALVDAIGRAEKEASAAVLVGRPERFCAGFDLKVMMSSPAAAQALLRRGADMLMKLYGAKLPLVAACTGHALAGGALVLLTTDVRVGASGPYRIGLNEVSIGLPVPILAHELARLRLDPRRLEEATLRGGTYAPDEAQQVGWVDRVSEPETLEADALKAAEQLVPIAGGHYALTKQTMRGPTVAYIRETMEQNLQAFAALSRR